MRRYFGLCGLMLSALFLLSSCLKDDEEAVTLYDDTAITAFQLTNGSLSYYPFTIDQVKGLIYNEDYLPYDTDVTKLLVSYSTKNNGTVWIENLAGDSVKYLLSTDSTDFSAAAGRNLRVYASNGSQSYKRYNVKVNVYSQDANAFTWENLTAETSPVNALTAKKLLCLGDSIYLLGLEEGSTKVYTTSNGTAWQSLATLGGDACKNAVVKGDSLFVLDGTELKALPKDGKDFVSVATAPNLMQLLGATSSELYAYSADSALMVSKDNGQTWEAEPVSAESADLLPTCNLAFCSSTFSYASHADYALLAGSRDLTAYSSDTTAVVWTKLVENASVKEDSEWNVIDFSHDSDYPLPRLENLTLLHYNGKYVAFGGKGLGGSTAEAFSTVYESRDGGLTWKKSSTFTLPDGLDTAATTLTATTDNNQYVWLVCGSQVWRGRLNKLGR